MRTKRLIYMFLIVILLFCVLSAMVEKRAQASPPSAAQVEVSEKWYPCHINPYNRAACLVQGIQLEKIQPDLGVLVKSSNIYVKAGTDLVDIDMPPEDLVRWASGREDAAYNRFRHVDENTILLGWN